MKFIIYCWMSMLEHLPDKYRNFLSWTLVITFVLMKDIITNCFSELFWYLSTKNTKNVASNAERCALWFRWVTTRGAKNLILPTEFCTTLRWKPARRPLMPIPQEISTNQRSFSDTSQPKTCYRWKQSSIFHGTWSLNFHLHFLGNLSSIRLPRG